MLPPGHVEGHLVVDAEAQPRLLPGTAGKGYSDHFGHSLTKRPVPRVVPRLSTTWIR